MCCVSKEKTKKRKRWKMQFEMRKRTVFLGFVYHFVFTFRFLFRFRYFVFVFRFFFWELDACIRFFLIITILLRVACCTLNMFATLVLNLFTFKLSFKVLCLFLKFKAFTLNYKCVVIGNSPKNFFRTPQFFKSLWLGCSHCFNKFQPNSN